MPFAAPLPSVRETLLVRLSDGCRTASTFRAAMEWGHLVGEEIDRKIGLSFQPAAQSIKRPLQAKSQGTWHIHLT
jgi:hypothetical protein